MSTDNRDPKKAQSAADFSLPQERVLAFVAHWHSQWKAVQESSHEDFDFDDWNDRVASVEQIHFFEGRSSQTANSFGSEADFNPETENVVQATVENNRSRVVTEILDTPGGRPAYHVFHLLQDGESNWKIEQVEKFYDRPDSVVLETNRYETALRLTFSSPDREKPDEKLRLDENVVFQDRRRVTIPELGESEVGVFSVGNLRCRTGVLGILDLGYDLNFFEPLTTRIPVGEYRVEISTAFERIAAMRLRFDPSKTATSWYAATALDGGSIYSVDSGNLAIFDLCALRTLTHEKNEQSSLGGLKTPFPRSCRCPNSTTP